MPKQRIIKRQDDDEGEWPSTDISGDWPEETSASSEDWSSSSTSWLDDQSTSSWSDMTTSESSWTRDPTTSSTYTPPTWSPDSSTSSSTTFQQPANPPSAGTTITRGISSASSPTRSGGNASSQVTDASDSSATVSSAASDASAASLSSSSRFLSSPSPSASAALPVQQGLSNIAFGSASSAAFPSTSALLPGIQSGPNTTPDGVFGAEGTNPAVATGKSGIKTEAVVGIVIGCLAAVIAIFLLLRTINAHYRQARTKRLLSQISFGTFGSPRSGAATPFSIAGLGKQSLRPTDAEPVVEKRESRIEVLAPRPQLGRPRSATYSRESDTPFWLEQLGLARPPRESRGGNPRLSVVAPSDTSSQLNSLAGRGQHHRMESEDSGNHLRPLRIRTRIPSPTLDGPATGSRSMTATDPLSSHGSTFSPSWSVSAGDFPVPVRPGLNRTSSEISAVPPYPGPPPVRNLQVPLQGHITSPTRRFSANNPYRQSAGASSVHTNPYSLYSHSLVAPSEYGTAPFELEERAVSPTNAQEADTQNTNTYYQHLTPTTALPSAVPKRHSSSSSVYSKEGHQVWPLSNSLPISGDSSPNHRVSNEWTRPGSTMEETYRTYSQILDEYSGTGRAL